MFQFESKGRKKADILFERPLGRFSSLSFSFFVCFTQALSCLGEGHPRRGGQLALLSLVVYNNCICYIFLHLCAHSPDQGRKDFSSLGGSFTPLPSQKPQNNSSITLDRNFLNLSIVGICESVLAW